MSLVHVQKPSPSNPIARSGTEELLREEPPHETAATGGYGGLSIAGCTRDEHRALRLRLGLGLWGRFRLGLGLGLIVSGCSK